jgi:hypothetical protein
LLRIQIFWDIMLCRWVSVSWRFLNDCLKCQKILTQQQHVTSQKTKIHLFKSYKFQSHNQQYQHLDLITLILPTTGSRQTRHFLTRGEHTEQQATCPHGLNSVSRFRSEHTRHSSRVTPSSPPGPSARRGSIWSLNKDIWLLAHIPQILGFYLLNSLKYLCHNHNRI